jgi:glycosyltransferase involved in cell wall biosynthesis
VWAIHESYSLPALWATYGSRLDPAVQKRGEAALRGASTAVFTADATRSLYEPYLPDLRCETLRYGIDVDALDEWSAGFDAAAERREQQIPADALVILCMGTIEPRKAQTQLIHAFAQVAARHPRAMLLIVGSRGDQYARAAHQAVALHGLQDRVRIEPVVPDPRPSYAIADLLVSASDLESTPRSMLEAMALGLAVLSTDVFGIPELIEDARTGWLFEPRDVGALAQALDRVLGLDSGSREALAERARSMVDTGYRSEICSREWLRVLQEAAAGRGAASIRGRGRGSVGR